MKRKTIGLIMAALMLASALSACGAAAPAASSAVSGVGSVGTVSEAASAAASSAASSSSAAGDTAFDYSAGLTDAGFFSGVTASELVTLPEYRGVSVPADVLTASDADMQEQIDYILQNYKTYEHVMDRAVADGDTLNIDYTGKVDGVAFDGGSTGGAGTNVTIGTTNYIDGFLDQLVGHKPGETFDINVTFPDPYTNNTALSGKAAVFTVTINYIQGAAQTTELTDEIVTKYTGGELSTADALKSEIKTWIVDQQKSKFFETLISTATCSEIPASVMEYVQNSELAKCKSYAARYGVDLATFLKNYAGVDSWEAFLTAGADDMKTTAVEYLAIQAIAEKEKLSADDAAVTAAGLDSYVATYGKPYLRMYLLGTKTVPDFVFANAAK